MKHFLQEWRSSIHLLSDTDLGFPLHLHKSAELVLVKDGALTLLLPDREYPLKQGDLAVIFPGQLHGYRTETSSKVSTIIFDPVYTQEHWQELETQHPSPPFLPAKNVDPDVYYAFERLYRKDLQDRFTERLAWVRLIVAMVMPRLKLTSADTSGGHDLVYRIVAYLSAHYTEPVTLDELAKCLHVNKYYLSHAFSAKLNSSFPNYLNCLRCDHAKMLLTATSEDILTVGELCGFDTQRTFDRVFKSYTGMTPREYRLWARKSDGS